MRTRCRRVAALVSQLVASVLLASFTAGARADPMPLDVWGEFSFGEVGDFAQGCDPADPFGNFCIPSSGTPTEFLGTPAWTFASVGPATLTVVDAFESGDRFEVFDFGISVGFTSIPLAGAVVDCGDDPAVCLGTAGMSVGTFVLGDGAHSLLIRFIEGRGSGGSGYLRVSARALPEPGTLVLLALGLLVLGVLIKRR